MRHKKLSLLFAFTILVSVFTFSAMTMAMKKTVLSAPAAVTGLSAVSSGKNRVTLSWKEVSGAEGYLVYAQKDGKYGYCGMTTKGTTFSDTKALDEDYNFYWVFAYVKDSSGKMITGGCEKYVFAKGVCAAALNLKATAGYYSIKLTWSASYGAEGYLVYGKTESGEYGYKGMTTKGTTWTDQDASISEYNFYWVFPYHKNADGKMITGLTGKYTYGKAMTYTKSVTGLKAAGKEKCVQLTWDKTDPADGYIIYRKVGSGAFTYRYMVTNPSFKDTTASTEDYNYYRVYPYITVKGERVVGPSTTYVYAKAYVKTYVLGDVTASLDSQGTMYLTGNGGMVEVWENTSSSSSGLQVLTCTPPWDSEKYLIRKVVVGPGVTYISSNAFYNCYNLTEVDLSSARSLDTIGNCAFSCCRSLQSLTIPDNTVKHLNDGSFGTCGIRELYLGEGLLTMSRTAFQANQYLESVTLPASLEIFDTEGSDYYAPFDRCSAMKEIKVASGSQHYYAQDNILYERKDGKVLLAYCPQNRAGTSLTIPDGVNVIRSGAFYGQKNLQTIFIPDSVTEIRSRALEACDALKKITGMKNVEEIGPRAISCCPLLSSIPALTNVKVIGEMAFIDDESLTSVTLGSKLETIGNKAFASTAIKTFSIPDSIKTIGTQAFPEGASVTLPKGMYQIEDGSYIWGKIEKVTGTRRYDYAYKVLDLVNQERKKEGLAPLTMDMDLLEAAMVRSAELDFSFSHARPNGTSCYTIHSKIYGENIAWGYGTPSSVMNAWMNSAGHKANILGDYKSIGIACFECNGGIYWVQVFGYNEALTGSKPSNRQVTQEVLVKIEK
ncbi:MAG: leucine-rich repeat protein [Clostridiales bacterium]|nr:leucine-rich repeat protein [Clostridiales bacterium]